MWFIVEHPNRRRVRDVEAWTPASGQGRVFKVVSDGALVEFASAVNAVQCAVDLQRAFASANDDLPEDRRIVMRIGVNQRQKSWFSEGYGTEAVHEKVADTRLESLNAAR
jgi:hypothetical protein